MPNNIQETISTNDMEPDAFQLIGGDEEGETTYINEIESGQMINSEIGRKPLFSTRDVFIS